MTLYKLFKTFPSAGSQFPCMKHRVKLKQGNVCYPLHLETNNGQQPLFAVSYR